ncbi:PIG-L family deacetylase [Krasilnikovia sp. MM14-A1259]|uniref:PIG-L family deacetylase n=1 Tax=Krasilnikovia sp. MM14-A1259 TaxID=3373539 RepID=UPI00399C777D
MCLFGVYLALWVTGAAQAWAFTGAHDRACITTMSVVAHEDDDLLFINPAIQHDIAAGRCVITVFVTAGDDGQGDAYWQTREQGPMAAYAAMAGVADHWIENDLRVDGRLLTRRQLPATRISLVFLRLPDGSSGTLRRHESLYALWVGRVRTVHPLDSSRSYTLKRVIHTLTGLMNHYQPTDIRTLDYVHPFRDGDHTDHHIVGHLTSAAQAAYRLPHRMTGYMGYPIAKLPVNLSRADRDQKLAAFLAYAPYDRRVCQTEQVCLHNSYAPRFSHSYRVGAAVSDDVPTPPPVDVPRMPRPVSEPSQQIPKPRNWRLRAILRRTRSRGERAAR